MVGRVGGETWRCLDTSDALRGVIRKPERYVHGKVQLIPNEDVSSWHFFKSEDIHVKLLLVLPL